MILLLSALDPPERSFIERLYLQYRAAMWRCALAIVHREDQADEVVQKTFVNLIGRVDKLRSLREKEVKAYILVAVRNTAYNLGRDMKPHRETDMGELPDPLASTEDIAMERLHMAQVKELVGELPQQDKDIIFLRFIMEMDSAAIGELLHLRPGTVRVRLHRALALLRKQLDKTGGD